MTKLSWTMSADLFQADFDRPDDHRFAEYLDTGSLASLVARVASHPPEAARRLSIQVVGRERMLADEVLSLARRPDFPVKHDGV